MIIHPCWKTITLKMLFAFLMSPSYFRTFNFCLCSITQQGIGEELQECVAGTWLLAAGGFWQQLPWLNFSLIFEEKVCCLVLCDVDPKLLSDSRDSAAAPTIQCCLPGICLISSSVKKGLKVHHLLLNMGIWKPHVILSHYSKQLSW